MDVERSCNWCGVWYPEDPTHYTAMERLQECGLPFAACLHHSDLDDEGLVKKPHWHVVITFRYQKTTTAAAKELGVAPNYLQACRDRDGALRYLIHLDNPDKFQYPIEEVFGSLASRIPQATEKLTEAEQAMSILALLDSMPVPTTYTAFLIAACKADLYATFRRMGIGAVHLLEDHNRGVCTAHPQVEADFHAYVKGFEDGHADGTRMAAFRLGCMRQSKFTSKG